MSPVEHDIVLVLLATGASVVVLSSVRAVLARGVYNRLHFLSPVTSLAGPLIGLALAVNSGWNLETALILATVVLLALTGPLLEAATARLAAQRDGLVPRESPR
jgi:multisubunit Na+/H+ antiporter MnhG subunit